MWHPPNAFFNFSPTLLNSVWRQYCMKSNHMDDIYSLWDWHWRDGTDLHKKNEKKHGGVLLSDSLMNMGAHLHILSCFWRRYRENTVFIVWSVYWQLSSYIIDVKSWNWFRCFDAVFDSQIQTSEHNRFWLEYVLPGFCHWAIPPHKFPHLFCMSSSLRWHLPSKIWSTPILALSGRILNCVLRIPRAPSVSFPTAVGDWVWGINPPPPHSF